MRTRLAALTAAVSFSGLVLSATVVPTAAFAVDGPAVTVPGAVPAAVPAALREATDVLGRARVAAEQTRTVAARTQSELATAGTVADRAAAAAAESARRVARASADAARATRTAAAARTAARATARAAALAQSKVRARSARSAKLRATAARRAAAAAALKARRADSTLVTLRRSSDVLGSRAKAAAGSAATRRAERDRAAERARAAAEAAALASAELVRAEADAARLREELLATPGTGQAGPTSPSPLPTGLPAAPAAGPAPSGPVAPAPAGAPAAAPAAPAVPAVVRPFSRGNAFWDAIGASPRLDPLNASVVAALSAPGTAHILNVTQYGQPIYTATPSTPRYRLHITNLGTGPGQWGDNDLAHVEVPIPLHAQPSPGTDGKLVVIDPVANKVYDMWVAERTPTGGPGGTAGWQVAWGGVYALDGDGSGHRATYGSGQYQVAWPAPVSRGTGSGISSLAGVLRVEELAAGVVDHALVFSTDIPCGPVDSSAYRFPATTTDGWITDSPCIPQGARIQLDPSLNLAAIPGITRAELVIGRALQTHGAYVMDKGGARMALVAETPENDAEAAVYTSSGVSWDYFGLGKLPWGSLRVLASYDGR